MERRQIFFRGQLRALGDGRTIVGTIPYNSPSEDLGGFTEIIRAGAFEGSLASRILALWDHNTDKPLGNGKQDFSSA